jgi:3-hydroxy acid dehydrogenase/malonic semialdehyde reductase
MKSRYVQSECLAGRVALITGASSGIGEATAFMLAEQGCNLVLVARRSDRLEEVRRRILENHTDVRVDIQVMDITEVDRVAHLHHCTGEIDILVCNAGLALGTAAADSFDQEEMEQMFQVNVMSAMSLFRAFVPSMRARNKGHIVFVGSVAGFESYEGGSVYSATKHALCGFANAARMDLVSTDVRVTMVNPGIVRSEFWLVRFNGDKEAADKALKGLDPLTPWDVADQIVFALTRPTHSQIADIRSYANHQAHAKYVIHRNT